jgi:hypothetical protein
MAVDHVGVIESEGARVLAAYRSNPDGRVPWSDRWTVRSVARHVAGSHHAVALILADRPSADFEQAAAMPRIETNDPAFPEWFGANTERLLTQCRTVPPAAVCWAPHPLLAGTAAYWTRRIAYDALVHRWDAEAGASIAGAPMEPHIAADSPAALLDYHDAVADRDPGHAPWPDAGRPRPHRRPELEPARHPGRTPRRGGSADLKEMPMDEPTTCGQGLAASAPVLTKLGALVTALAAVLDTHRKALPLTDDAARQEAEAYARIAGQVRSSAEQLDAAAEQMVASRDLPMGAHDMDALSSPRAVEVFAAFVRSERDLVELLGHRVEDDEAMLTDMTSG